MTVRRGTQYKTENIIIALNKFMEHPHIQLFVWLVFLCPPIISPSILRGKKKAGKDVEKSGKYNSRFTTVSVFK